MTTVARKDRCSGSGFPTVASRYSAEKATCPVCTKHLNVFVGVAAPPHKQAVGYWRVK